MKKGKAGGQSELMDMIKALGEAREDFIWSLPVDDLGRRKGPWLEKKPVDLFLYL